MPPLALDDPVTAVPGVSARAAGALDKAFGIQTVRDLVEHYPAQGKGKYRDAGAVMSLTEAPHDEPVTLIGTVGRWSIGRPRGRKLTIARTMLTDELSGRSIEIALFNQEWRARQLPSGTRVAASGIVDVFRGKLQLKNARISRTDEAIELMPEGERFRPTYPATEALASGRIAALVGAALDALPPVPDPVPVELRAERGLLGLDDALRTIHRPPEVKAVEPARRRLVYDELLTLQLGLQMRRHRLEADEVGVEQPLRLDGLAAQLLDRLPFEATVDQRKAMGEIAEDLAAPKPMHRLLQGDVGTGKTIVGAWAMLCAVDAGHQAVLMAPTEILAEQHHRTLTRLLGTVGVNGVADSDRWQAPVGADLFGGPRLELVTGSTPAKKLRGLLADLTGGRIQMLIGTHALLEDRVQLRDLGVVVIDEQHRFGVEHRARLRDKRADHRSPDVLVMTATPIPRSLALTVYGDLDVTVLRERPFDIDVKTLMLPSDSPRRDKLYGFIRERVSQGQRAYIVCPLIEESEALPGIAAAETVHAHLSGKVFGDLGVGLVHGRMTPGERDDTMEAFRDGRIQILVATTVIEVGVDIPEATIMLIEDADRFGISQLHQLRGRLYRGLDDNWCVLFSSSTDGNPRLEALVESNDGFDLAETDLRLRGEGSLFDTRQSGLPDLKLASLLRDAELVAATREDARRLIADEPDLARHPDLLVEVRRRYGAERFAALEAG
jgi:ATP-dependent DNA helicase RecG